MIIDQYFLVLIHRPEGERLVLCTEHMQSPVLTGQAGVVAGRASTVQDAQRTRSNGNFHQFGAEFTKV